MPARFNPFYSAQLHNHIPVQTAHLRFSKPGDCFHPCQCYHTFRKDLTSFPRTCVKSGNDAFFASSLRASESAFLVFSVSSKASVSRVITEIDSSTPRRRRPGRASSWSAAAGLTPCPSWRSRAAGSPSNIARCNAHSVSARLFSRLTRMR